MYNWIEFLYTLNKNIRNQLCSDIKLQENYWIKEINTVARRRAATCGHFLWQHHEELRKWTSLMRVPLLATPKTVIRGILQARILEWVAFPLTRGSS